MDQIQPKNITVSNSIPLVRTVQFCCFDQRSHPLCPKIMTSYPLLVAQYAIIGHPRRTEHWSLVVLVSRDEGYVYEILGDWSDFAYHVRYVEHFLESSSFRGGCIVGQVPGNMESIFRLERSLEVVSIIHNDSNFDCQDWVLEAIKLLRGTGVINPETDEAMIRNELQDEYERWETGEDNLIERLYSNIRR